MPTTTTSLPVSRPRSPWPLLSFGLCVALLLVPVILGNAAARAGGAAGLTSVLLALAVSVRRLRRVEHGESRRPPAWVQLVGEALAGMTGYFLCLAAFIALVLVAIRRPGAAAAAGAALALALAMTWAAGKQWRRVGVERLVFLESSCIAFFVTVVVSGGYALFESLGGASPISLWAVWTVGLLTWAVAGAVRTRQLG